VSRTALAGLLLLAAPLAGCLIPEPRASHGGAGASDVPAFEEDPSPLSEPELGVPPTPLDLAAPAPAPAPAAAQPAATEEAQSQPEVGAPNEQEAAQQSSTPQEGQAPQEGATESAGSGEQPQVSSAPPEAATGSGTEQASSSAAILAQDAPVVQEPAPLDLPTPPSTGLANGPPEVLELLRRYYTAFSAGDWATAADCFWEGAGFGSVRSRTNDEKDIPGEEPQPVVLILPAKTVFDEFIAGTRVLEPVTGKLAGTTQILRTGDVAHAWCRYEATYGPEGEKMTWHRYDSVQLVMHENVWKISSLIQSRSVDKP
jgi:hypothetical protein